ncbi:hypothetical protein [Fangia hongkongensis]|uniref:hypothetical protein n=1 Tax=Fangia hongkongensis TaxID=270495 RepID=UPI0003A778D6|nr:hypothetical protein [Fangia hongkongensis]
MSNYEKNRVNISDAKKFEYARLMVDEGYFNKQKNYGYFKGKRLCCCTLTPV